MIRVKGRKAAPASVAEYPWIPIRLNGRKNSAPLSAK
jgi:hypothetical protein